jgi:deoxyribodipyrimidine photolyase-like uncharacterized protein
VAFSLAAERGPESQTSRPTTLYWDFLLRHETMLAKNPRTVMQVRNAARLTPAQRRDITDHVARLRAAIPAAT